MNKQEAIDSLECFRSNTAHILGDNDEKVKTIETCIMLVKEAEEVPSAQPEIVRCKECKHAPKCYGDVLMRSRGGGYIYCPVEYCSAAERRSDE